MADVVQNPFSSIVTSILGDPAANRAAAQQQLENVLARDKFGLDSATSQAQIENMKFQQGVADKNYDLEQQKFDLLSGKDTRDASLFELDSQAKEISNIKARLDMGLEGGASGVFPSSRQSVVMPPLPFAQSNQNPRNILNVSPQGNPITAQNIPDANAMYDVLVGSGEPVDSSAMPTLQQNQGMNLGGAITPIMPPQTIEPAALTEDKMFLDTIKNAQTPVAGELGDVLNSLSSSGVSPQGTSPTEYRQKSLELQDQARGARQKQYLTPTDIAQADALDKQANEYNNVANQIEGNNKTGDSGISEYLQGVDTDDRAAIGQRLVEVGVTIGDDKLIAKGNVILNQVQNAEAKKDAAYDNFLPTYETKIKPVADLSGSLMSAMDIIKATTKDGEILGVGTTGDQFTPSWLTSEDGLKVQSALQSVGNKLAAARSGSAVTANEVDRIARELGFTLSSNGVFTFDWLNPPSDTKLAIGLNNAARDLDRALKSSAASIPSESLDRFIQRGGLNPDALSGYATGDYLNLESPSQALTPPAATAEQIEEWVRDPTTGKLVRAK